MKPETRKEARLREKFKAEDEIPYEIARDAREAKRVWKRATSKHRRGVAKQQLQKALDE